MTDQPRPAPQSPKSPPLTPVEQAAVDLLAPMILSLYYRTDGLPAPAARLRPSYTEAELRQRPRYRPGRTP